MVPLGNYWALCSCCSCVNEQGSYLVCSLSTGTPYVLGNFLRGWYKQYCVPAVEPSPRASSLRPLAARLLPGSRRMSPTTTPLAAIPCVTIPNRAHCPRGDSGTGNEQRFDSFEPLPGGALQQRQAFMYIK